MVANIFGNSPVRPLEKHVEVAYRCTKQLHPFFSAALAGDWDQASAFRDEIDRLEREDKRLFVPLMSENSMIATITDPAQHVALPLEAGPAETRGRGDR